MAIVLNSDAKTLMGISSSDYDALLTALISRAQKWIENQIGWNIEAAEHTEYFDGDGDPNLILRHRPLNSISVFQIDDTDVSSDDYKTYSNPPEIILTAGVFVTGIKNVKVTYNAGYAAESIPDDLKQAVLDLVDQMFQRRGAAGVRSESAGDFSRSYNVESVASDFVKSVIAQYRIT